MTESNAVQADTYDDITQRLNEIHADVGYLFGRVAADGDCAGEMAESVRARIDAIKALLSKLSAPVADERVSDDTLWSWAEQIMGGKEAHHVGRDRVLRFARAALASVPVHDKEVDEALAERDEREEIIDKLLDLVLGSDRTEWSSAYDYSDALAEVEDYMHGLSVKLQASAPVADERDADAAEAFQMAKDDRATFPASTVRKLWELKERYRRALASAPVCQRCGGTGEADSGGIHPWGAPALIPCECTISAPVAGEAQADLAPPKCPITGRPFFMALEHAELGMVPTYGGPYDSYTIPHLGGRPDQPRHERELRVYRYDHDLGGWITDETEVIPLRIVHEDVLHGLEDAAPQASEAAAELPAPVNGEARAWSFAAPGPVAAEVRDAYERGYRDGLQRGDDHIKGCLV